MRKLVWLLAVSLSAWPAGAQEEAPPEAEAPAAEAPPAESPAPKEKKPKGKPPPEGQSQVIDKARFEAYLKERLAKIDSQQRRRLDFFDSEKKLWESFWTKVRKDRRDFEYRLTRQTLNIFDALASLDPKDHGTTIKNFEKMQADFIRSFESQQGSKMSEFFTNHEARWKEFAAEQERERQEFTTEAGAGWQHNKATLEEESGVSKKKKKRKPEPEGPPPGTIIKAGEEKPSKMPTATEKEDVWH